MSLSRYYTVITSHHIFNCHGTYDTFVPLMVLPLTTTQDAKEKSDKMRRLMLDKRYGEQLELQNQQLQSANRGETALPTVTALHCDCPPL